MRLHLLTAVHTTLAEHLDETAASVADLRDNLRADDIDVLWHVVIDGEGIPPHRPEGSHTYKVAGRQIGVAAARNLALSATSGDGWVFRLDGDDTLDVEGWQSLLADPLFGTTHWHPTNLTDQHGKPTPHWFNTSRLWGRHAVEENWTTPMPFHPNNVVVKAELALEVGGWPALRVNEDILWCFALNQCEAGHALPHVTLRYRKWEQQTVNGDRYLADKAAAFTFIEAVTNTRRTKTGLAPIRAPKLTHDAPSSQTQHPA